MKPSTLTVQLAALFEGAREEGNEAHKGENQDRREKEADGRHVFGEVLKGALNEAEHDHDRVGDRLGRQGASDE